MNLREALSERMVIGVLTIGGFIVVAETILILFGIGKSIPDGTSQGIVGVFGTAVGLIMGGVFRSDRVDQQRAATADAAVNALAAATPTAPPPVTPVQVVNQPAEPVPVAPQEPTP